MAELPLRVVDVVDGLAKATINSPDGVTTLITVRPNGAIARHQSYTDDEGREVIKWVGPDGSWSETIVDAQRNVTVTTTSEPGVGQTVTQSFTLANGEVAIDVEHPDGRFSSESITMLPNGGEQHTIHDQLGRVTTRTIAKDVEGNSEEVLVEPDGSVTNTFTVHGPGGLTRTIVTDSVGSRTERSTDVYKDAGGNTVTVEKNESGTKMTMVHADGSVDERLENANGTTETKTWTLYPDGTAEMVQSFADGSRRTVLQTKNADGSYSTKAEHSDGTVVEYVIRPDGTVASTIRDPHGIVTRSVTEADGQGSTRVEEPGEAPHVVTNDRVLSEPVHSDDMPRDPMPPLDATPAAVADNFLVETDDDGPTLHDALMMDAPLASGDDYDTDIDALDRLLTTREPDGSTYLGIRAPDGLETRIGVAADGAITRTQMWQDEGANVRHVIYPDSTSMQEREYPNGTIVRTKYDAHGNTEEDETGEFTPDGNFVRTITYRDGSMMVDREEHDIDGTTRHVVTTREGALEVSSVRTYRGDDGSSIEETHAADTSSTVKTTYRDGHTETIKHLADGTAEYESSETLPDGTKVDRSLDDSGNATVTRTTHEPQGLVRIVTTHPDGEVEERIDQQYVDPATGNIVEIHKGLGQTETTIYRSDGMYDIHTVHSDGSTESESFNRYPNGTTVLEKTLDDGRHETTTQITNEDGSFTTQHVAYDGTEREHTVQPDGVVLSAMRTPEGYEEHTRTRVDGSATTHFSEPGLETRVITRDPVLLYPVAGRDAEYTDYSFQDRNGSDDPEVAMPLHVTGASAPDGSSDNEGSGGGVMGESADPTVYPMTEDLTLEDDVLGTAGDGATWGVADDATLGQAYQAKDTGGAAGVVGGDTAPDAWSADPTLEDDPLLGVSAASVAEGASARGEAGAFTADSDGPTAADTATYGAADDATSGWAAAAEGEGAGGAVGATTDDGFGGGAMPEVMPVEAVEAPADDDWSLPSIDDLGTDSDDDSLFSDF